jgi:hypothetical protein
MTKQTKHTAGPWQMDSRHYPNSFTISAGEVLICQVDHWGKRQSDLTAELKPEGQAEANAHLIAAAPDLLAALEDIELRATQAKLAHDIGRPKLARQVDFLLGELARLQDVARNALAKATHPTP